MKEKLQAFYLKYRESIKDVGLAFVMAISLLAIAQYFVPGSFLNITWGSCLFVIVLLCLYEWMYRKAPAWTIRFVFWMMVVCFLLANYPLIRRLIVGTT